MCCHKVATIALVVMEIFLFIIDIIYKLGLFLVAVLGLYLSYKAYQLEKPRLNIDILVINGTQYEYEYEEQAEAAIYFITHITNISKRPITICTIKNNKNKQITAVFMKNKKSGYTLTESEWCTYHFPIYEDKIKELKQSKKLYVSDFADRKFYLKKNQLKNIKQHINQLDIQTHFK